MVTCWTTADFANRESCFFIRLNDASRKTLLQAAKKKSRKLTDDRKHFLPQALIANVQCFMTSRELWEMVGRGEVGEG